MTTGEKGNIAYKWFSSIAYAFIGFMLVQIYFQFETVKEKVAQHDTTLKLQEQRINYLQIAEDANRAKLEAHIQSTTRATE